MIHYDHLLLGSQEQRQQTTALDEQPTEGRIRRLVALCRELIRQYHTAPAAMLERAWWLAFHQAGVQLRGILEEYRNQWHTLDLTDKEVEQAYLTLIQAAYFFEPGGVAEALFQEQGWVW